ncbi:MAG: hypothetical protein V3W07_01665 [Syntrophobacteria bacterium]|jgi:hypothetical protein
MTDKEIRVKLKELDRLYAEHANNQGQGDFEMQNKLRIELLDSFLALKPYLKKQTKLQWYEPTYNYAITGNLEYIEAAREDLAHIIGQETDPDSP